MSAELVEFRTKEVPGDYSSLQAKVECYQKPLREWRDHLSASEAVVLLQIIDRTVGWGRREAYFTTRAMLEGDDVYSGLSISRATLFRALASLEKKGFIRRRKDPRIPDRVHYTVNMNWSPDVPLNLPKRLKNKPQTPSHSETTPSHIETDPSHSETLYTGNNLQVSPTGSQPGATAPVSSSPADRVREKAETARSAHRATLQTKTETAQAIVTRIEATWRAALIDTFPGTAYRTWGVREKAQVKLAHRNWRGDIGFPEFVDWAVRNWSAIIAKQFRWMTKEPPPTVPVLSFLIAFLTQFADCRAEGKLEQWLSQQDRQSIDALMKRRGLTWEQAMAQVAESKATVALRKEMEERETKAAARERAADGKLQRAQRLAEFEGRAPIHPRSPAAERMRREQPSPRPTHIASDDPEFTGASVPMVDPDRNPFDE